MPELLYTRKYVGPPFSFRTRIKTLAAGHRSVRKLGLAILSPLEQGLRLAGVVAVGAVAGGPSFLL